MNTIERSRKMIARFGIARLIQATASLVYRSDDREYRIGVLTWILDGCPCD